MGENLNTGVLDPDHVRRRPGAGLALRQRIDQRWIVVGHNHGDGQRAQHVEEDQPPHKTARRLGNIAALVRTLGRSHAHQLRAQNEREGALDDPGVDVREVPQRAAREMMREGPRVLPVAEPETIMLRPTTPEQDERKNNQPHDTQDLDGRKPKLGLTVYFDGGEVQQHDNKQEDGDPDPLGDRGSPVLDNPGGRRTLGGHQDHVTVVVIPASSESQRRVYVPSDQIGRRPGTVGAVSGQEAHHLAQCAHDRVDHRGDNDVRNEQPRGAACMQRGRGPDQ